MECNYKTKNDSSTSKLRKMNYFISLYDNVP